MRFFLFLSLPLFFVFSACGDELPGGGNAVVNGSWTLERATRNNMETALLDGLIFEFKDDGTLVTNLMGNTKVGTYTWEGDQIVTEGVTIPMTYTVKSLTDSTMHLQSKYQDYQFGFELVR